MKRLIIALGIVGLISLGACSLGQPTASSSSKQAVSSESSTDTSSLKPTTQTGEASITLNSVVTPLKTGKNTLMLSVMDAKTGKPLVVDNIKVEMVMTEKEMKVMGMDGTGSAKTVVKPASSPGMFEISTSLPYAGNWQLKANIGDMQPPASAIFDLVVK